ncbi:glycosyltransferase, partial [Candidatus Thioglobus sp.]|nr:glycosyltransferase [Candidatus Thioglobus sp.]
IVPSTYTENSFVNRNILLDKIVKIPLQGKVDVPSIKKFQKSRSSDKFIVGVVGGNLLRKGFIYLLRAWDEMNINNSYLYIKAEKNQLEKSNEIKEIIERNDNIKFVGYVENINDFYQKCDIFCLPSIDEGYGMVVPEAMANSLPVITTTNVGASDLINDSVNGFIVKPFNSEILEEKIMFFYNNRNEIEKMGVNSYFKYADYLNSNDNCKNSIQKFYNSLNKLRPLQNKVAI